ncbi:MAG: MCP four helix bundle domain-containing protein, partial [Burkholderiaceae bacterium]|nr:MCP four helix bundle domain-containing protein [Burkholderiaceae bacterium]
MLQKIKIGTRLALAFAVLLLLIGALAAGGIFGAKRLTERSAALYEQRTVPLGVLAEISHLTQRNRVLVMDMLMDPGTSNLQASHTALVSNVERIRALWDAYTAQPLGVQEQGLAQAFAAANTTYLNNGLLPAATALVGGKYDDGSELYITQIRPNALKVQEAVEQLVALQIQVAQEEFGAAKTLSETIHMGTLIASVLALLVGAVMASVITRSISRPLRQAVVLARTVASGDLSAQIVVNGTDETAELLGALQEMNRQLVRVITQVRDSTETVARDTILMAGGIEDLARRTEVQASNLQETAASMEQLNITVQHNTDNAHRASALAHEASAVAA